MKEISSGRILLKRMAFALLSGEVDQYVKFLPNIQGTPDYMHSACLGLCCYCWWSVVSQRSCL